MKVMYSIHDFIMKTLRDMVGNYLDCQVRKYALDWYKNGDLTEEDVTVTVENWIEAQYPTEELPEITEEV